MLLPYALCWSPQQCESNIGKASPLNNRSKPSERGAFNRGKKKKVSIQNSHIAIPWQRSWGKKESYAGNEYNINQGEGATLIPGPVISSPPLKRRTRINEDRRFAGLAWNGLLVRGKIQTAVTNRLVLCITGGPHCGANPLHCTDVGIDIRTGPVLLSCSRWYSDCFRLCTRTAPCLSSSRWPTMVKRIEQMCTALSFVITRPRTKGQKFEEKHSDHKEAPSGLTKTIVLSSFCSFLLLNKPCCVKRLLISTMWNRTQRGIVLKSGKREQFMRLLVYATYLHYDMAAREDSCYCEDRGERVSQLGLCAAWSVTHTPFRSRWEDRVFLYGRRMANAKTAGQ
jgi:hypothetical protein